MNKFKRAFNHAVIYLKEIITSAVLLIVALLIALTFTKLFSIPVLIIFLIFIILLLYLIGRRREAQLTEIKDIINAIRLNQYNSADEIKLGKDLAGLENDIKAMFERTQNDIANLKKLEQVRKEFLSNVSHELRTPIFAIQGYLETLLDGAVDDPNVNKNFLQKANRHTLNLNNLLNDLIDISMIESGRMRMSFRYFLIGEYLENLVNEYNQVVDENNMMLSLHPVRKKLKVFGDKDRLKQVFDNLIRNAVKYSGGSKIELLVEEGDEDVTIKIRDNGVGIPQSELDRVFERFYRTEKVRSSNVSGTGLGLAIVKHIIEAHGSKVTVNSEQNEGTEFLFQLKK
jgi:two-component system phosphate regulon sensor histidine kinase PhoR